MSIIVSEQKINFNTFFEKINENKRYFKISMSFFDTNLKIHKLSNSAKILYSLMLDLTTLSAKNKFYDEQGNIYIFFTREKAMEYLNCSSTTICKIFKELKKYDLIYEKRQGFRKANKIYVKNFCIDENKNIITSFINISAPKVIKLSEKKNIKINYLLFTDKQIAGILSNDAKILYSLLLYRNNMSLKKNFTDRQGHICVNFKRNEVQQLLNCSKDKASRLFRELTDNNLIKEVRQRLTLPNLIYLCDFINNETLEYNVKQNNTKESEQSAKILDCFEVCKENSDILKKEIKEQIQYNYVSDIISSYNNPDLKILDEIVNIIYYVKNTQKPSLKIGGKLISIFDINFAFAEVKALNILKVYNNYIEKLKIEEIKNPVSYILAMIYNSVFEMQNNKMYKFFIKKYSNEISKEKIRFLADKIEKNRYTEEAEKMAKLLRNDIYIQNYINQYYDENWSKIISKLNL